MVEAPEALHEAVLREAVRGLGVPSGVQKTLSPWMFYDAEGTALFEQITTLPEYYLTRAERSIFETFSTEIVSFPHTPITVAELGAGTAAKTGTLLAAAIARQPDLLYQPIDVSESALNEAAGTLTAAMPELTVRPQVANYITETYRISRPAGTSILALYIGSSIGNFAPTEAMGILRKLRKQLKGSDALLLGVDLAPCCRKSVDDLLAAYNDAAGVTAAFNLNILARLNRDLDTEFDLSAFAHRVRWNAAESRIEMHLESLSAQTVLLDGYRIRFEAGETIHTENSYKFTERSLRPLLAGAGFGSPHLFHDSNHQFTVAMAHPG